MSTFDKLIAAGAENLHPIFTARVERTRKDGSSYYERAIVARDVDGTVYLTDDGKGFLQQTQPPVAKAPRAKKSAPVEEIIDDLADLDLPD